MRLRLHGQSLGVKAGREACALSRQLRLGEHKGAGEPPGPAPLFPSPSSPSAHLRAAVTVPTRSRSLHAFSLPG